MKETLSKAIRQTEWPDYLKLMIDAPVAVCINCYRIGFGERPYLVGIQIRCFWCEKEL